jgi:hypothetical protein
MSNKKKFVIEFEDESAKATGKKHDGIQISLTEEESLSSSEVDGVPSIAGNGPAPVKLGEILIRMGLSEYASGFHLHVNEDFNSDQKEILIIGVD